MIGARQMIKTIPLEDMQAISQLIKQIRKQRGMTQEKLGELIGVRKDRISKIERHLSNTTLLTLYQVFNALGVKVTIEIENGKIQTYQEIL